MTVSPKQFEQFIVKLAQDSAPGDNEGATLGGQQTDAVPELLQPEDGPGEGPRGEFEAMSSGAEKAHADNREGEGGYLQDAFDNFDSAAKQTGKEMKELLTSFGPDAIVSRATPEAGATKISSITIKAFEDEFMKIARRRVRGMRRWAEAKRLIKRTIRGQKKADPGKRFKIFKRQQRMAQAPDPLKRKQEALASGVSPRSWYTAKKTAKPPRSARQQPRIPEYPRPEYMAP